MNKGLEALYTLFQKVDCEKCFYKYDCDECLYVDIIEKELKALEIIKKKNVEIWTIKMAKDVETYNELVLKYKIYSPALTQKEFDLLKDVLEDA